MSRDLELALPRLAMVCGLLASGPVLAGCGGNGTDSKPRGGVSVVVTYGGEPVTGAHLDLHNPDTGEAGGAKLSDDGKASLEGLAEGTYVVTVVPPMPDPRPPEPGEPPRVAQEFPTIPQKFRSTATSPLKAEVKAGTTEEFRFDLKDESQ